MTETTETSDRTGTVLFYDGSCGMCLRTVGRLRPWMEPQGIQFESFPPGVEQLEMKLRYPGGRMLGGAGALVAMARLVWWLRPLTTLTRLPGVMPLLRRGYRKLAANRHCIRGACGWTPPAPTAGPVNF